MPKQKSYLVVYYIDGDIQARRIDARSHIEAAESQRGFADDDYSLIVYEINSVKTFNLVNKLEEVPEEDQ